MTYEQDADQILQGLLFRATSWVLMVPWFEFYLPWNVLLEPFPLVAVELLCWAGVLLVVALTISGVDRPGRLLVNDEPSGRRRYHANGH